MSPSVVSRAGVSAANKCGSNAAKVRKSVSSTTKFSKGLTRQ
jgi:hypothetical protein